ncbi:orotidine-5'-phosphate decarboxylase, partial [Pseudomonas syringae]
MPIDGSRLCAGSATMRADFDLPETTLMSACQTPVIVALDFPTREAALRLADQLDPKLC